MHIVNENTHIGCVAVKQSTANKTLSGPKCANKTFSTPLHHLRPWIHAVGAKFSSLTVCEPQQKWKSKKVWCVVPSEIPYCSLIKAFLSATQWMFFIVSIQVNSKDLAVPRWSVIEILEAAHLPSTLMPQSRSPWSQCFLHYDGWWWTLS